MTTTMTLQMQNSLLQVKNLVQHFELPLSWMDRCLRRERRFVHAVNGVSFEIGPGEVFSLVGESGCGKSTIARTVVRLLTPRSGEIVFEGREIGRLKARELRPIRREIQMVFQNPYASLDPRQRVGEILMEPLLFHGIAGSREEALERMFRLMDITGLHRDQANRYPHQFSGGQRQRIGIARALATGPKLIVADEPVSALDVSIQAQILNLMMDLREEFHLSYLFISHNLAVVRHVTDRVGIMYLGFIVEQAGCDDIFEHPLHPYTKALLDAAPSVDKDHIEAPLSGEVPSPLTLPPGCVFASRCPKREKLCDEERPPLKKNGSREVACHFVE
ncbi:MAG: ATP-binding cassette domain-containing protein [Synergistaceae bacterium]|jgi:oligopeptide/dipeptide ABC transporter ATP-binding protein|nr:ATP-binding cassette domain-containing protein [Synergistaceae bacterium]